MARNKPHSNELFILISSVLFYLIGCAHLAPVQSMDRNSEIKEALIKAWDGQKKQGVIYNQKWETFSEKTLPTQSACSDNKAEKFEIYELEKSSITSTENTVTTALYCSSEKRYWIERVGGDIAFEYRYLGPFALDEK